MTFTSTKTYSILTLGCQMNIHDSEIIASSLQANGYNEYVNDSFDPSKVDGSLLTGQEIVPDVIVYNTCAVRENAKIRLLGLLGQLVHLKKFNKDMKVIVAGCLSQNERDNIIKDSKVVDIVVGTYNLHSIPSLLQKSIETGDKKVEVLDVFPKEKGFVTIESPNKNYANVSISMGCNQKCSFCIVPFVRGNLVCRPVDDIVKECELHVKNGVKEITLLGQNVNNYRFSQTLENHFENIGFEELLEKVALIPDLKRLRFMSPHPAYFTDKVIDIMAKYKNIMPSIHMPMQSGSTKLLKEMNRGYTYEHYFKVIKKIRKQIPDIEITTDLITGFVGETLEDHQATINAVKECEFLSTYNFIYSPRPGTKSLNMGEMLPKEEIQRRFEELHKVTEETGHMRHKNYLGKTVKVMIQKEVGRKDNNRGTVSGKDEHGILVHIQNNPDFLEDGEIVEVKVIETGPHHLVAIL